MIPGCLNNSFVLEDSSVTPEIALNSPPDRVVGIVICGIDGPISVPPSTLLPLRSSSILRTSVILFEIQSAIALAASVKDPPPNVTIRSAFFSIARFVAATTSFRGVCGDISKNSPTHLFPRLLRILSISSVLRFKVPLANRKTRLAS